MSKSIELTDEIYERLSQAKLPGESISDVIARLLSKGEPSDALKKWLLTPYEGEPTNSLEEHDVVH